MFKLIEQYNETLVAIIMTLLVLTGLVAGWTITILVAGGAGVLLFPAIIVVVSVISSIFIE